MNATVRLVPGINPGCIGAWDGSVPFAADTVLERQGAWRPRPAGYPLPTGREVQGDGFGRDQDLPYVTTPYFEWKDVALDDAAKQCAQPNARPTGVALGAKPCSLPSSPLHQFCSLSHPTSLFLPSPLLATWAASPNSRQVSYVPLRQC